MRLHEAAGWRRRAATLLGGEARPVGVASGLRPSSPRAAAVATQTEELKVPGSIPVLGNCSCAPASPEDPLAQPKAKH